MNMGKVGSSRRFFGLILICVGMYWSWKEKDWIHVAAYIFFALTILFYPLVMRLYMRRIFASASARTMSGALPNRLAATSRPRARSFGQFQSEDQAKTFLIEKISAQAEREGAPLTLIEKRMLAWSSEHEDEKLAAAFAVDHNDAVFEKLISGLYARALTADIRRSKTPHQRAVREVRREYSDASRMLAQGDHYLSVMIAPGFGGRLWIPGADRLMTAMDTFSIWEVVGLFSLLLMVWGGVLIESEQYGWPHWWVAMSVFSVLTLTIGLRLGWVLLSPQRVLDRRYLFLIIGLLCVIATVAALVQIRVLPQPAMSRTILGRDGFSFDWLIAAGIGIAAAMLVEHVGGEDI